MLVVIMQIRTSVKRIITAVVVREPPAPTTMAAILVAVPQDSLMLEANVKVCSMMETKQ